MPSHAGFVAAPLSAAASGPTFRAVGVGATRCAVATFWGRPAAAIRATSAIPAPAASKGSLTWVVDDFAGRATRISEWET
jgi:hypothetical protein